LLVLAGIAIAIAAMLAYQASQPGPHEWVQDDIDAAVLHTLETRTLPSKAAKAAELVRESVVRVTGYVDQKDVDEAEAKDGDHKDPVKEQAKEEPKAPKDGKPALPSREPARSTSRRAREGKEPPKEANAGKGRDPGRDKDKDAKDSKRGGDAKDKGAKDGGSMQAQADPAKKPHPPIDPDMSRNGERKGRIATGVVIVENGIILTSLHVVAGAKRITVTFSDGMESDADIIGVQPENDLAVLRAKKVPDDQPAATLGSSAKLKPGDEVVAVGFPFGIGPSVSAGVVSGLNREFRSQDGSQALSKLIQFDAAVNPGNSGGPLITMDGEVVGIVAALLNPTEHRTFIGIGFAVTIESAGSAVGIPPF
jgi:S1-C subfamily serine protease